MKQPITMIRGTTHTVYISLSTALGEQRILSDGEIIRFGVKKRPTDTNFVIQKELTNSNYDCGSYVLTLVPSDTKDLPFGYYYYDAGIQIGNTYFNIIECSKFEIRYNITSMEGE